MSPTPSVDGTGAGTAIWRPEIQGLRALAASLVAGYHIWFDRVSGAIDVFFVVSGFLITGLLVRRLESEGRIRPGPYLARIARRILPAAYFVLGAVIVASALWLSPVAWYDTLGDIRAAALYVANWAFAFGAVDYFAADSAQNPVLHYWALSVQAQFYVAWPLLLGAVALVARRVDRDLRRSIVVVLAVLAAASFALAVHGTATNQPFTYFSTLARLWEFCLGGIVAVRFAATVLPDGIRRLAGWAGVVMIVGTGALIDGSVSFPGAATLSPTLATCLILIAGASGDHAGALAVLSSRPFIWLGNISYALFLWHWPVLVFVHLRVGARPLTILEGSLVLAVSILLAAATTRLVEAPFRREVGALGTGRFAWALGGIPIIMILALTWMTQRDAITREVDIDAYPGPRVFAAGWQGDLPDAPIVPALTMARDDFPDDGGRACFQRARDDTVLRCVFGVRDGGRTIALVGGSHARQWLTAMEEIAQRHRLRILTFTKASCRFQFPADTESCTRWNQGVIAALLEDRPDVVFTTATVVAHDAPESIPIGFLTQWATLDLHAIPVIAIRDNPRFPFDPPDCVARHGPESEVCSLPRSRVMADVNPAAGIDLPGTVRLIDLTDWLCSADACPVVAGNILIYRDDDHISATYSRALAPFLEDEMRRVAPWLFPAS